MKTICTHTKRGKITEEQATVAKKVAKDCYDRALMDPDYADSQYIIDIGQDMLYKSAGIEL
jgi:hypothetical protein